MRKLYTKEDILAEAAFARCLECLRLAGVPESLRKQVQPGPALNQIVHCIAYLEMHWRDAFRWVAEHHGEVLKHAESFNEPS